MGYCYSIEIFNFDKKKVVSASLVEIEVVLKLLDVYKAYPNIVIYGNCKMEGEQTAEWIPISDRLPEESLNSVIGWDAYRKRCVFVQFIDGHFQIAGKNESFDIQAWMPLPESYKAE